MIPVSTFQEGLGYLLAGQSGCREQPISAQGCLERVLQTASRSLPWHCVFHEQGLLLKAVGMRDCLPVGNNAYRIHCWSFLRFGRTKWRTSKPHAAERTEPRRTPILTPASKSKFPCSNASVPINRLMVKPMPHNTATPYTWPQVGPAGNFARPNKRARATMPNTPSCLPANSPRFMPTGPPLLICPFVTLSNGTPSFA